jgi:sodium transport system ATP-binding protein
MIEVSGLRKSFGSVTALDGIDFKARDGEVTGQIGPNGAGRTTALRTIYAVMKPDSGVAAIDEFDTVLHCP